MDFKEWCQRYVAEWNLNPKEKQMTLEEAMNDTYLKEIFEKGSEVDLASPERSARITGFLFRAMDIAYENLQQVKKK